MNAQRVHIHVVRHESPFPNSVFQLHPNKSDHVSSAPSDVSKLVVTDNNFVSYCFYVPFHVFLTCLDFFYSLA